MRPERWREILGHVKDNFEVEEESSDHFDQDGGTDVEWIVFNGPLGKMKLEFVTKPVVLDKKTSYSRRIGSETKVEYIYSDTEKSNRFTVCKWNDDSEEWIEIEAKNLEL